MKKILVVTVCLLTILLTMVNAYGDSTNGSELAAAILEKYSEEVEQIILTVKDQQSQWVDYLGNNPDKIDFSHMYRVYYLKLKDINAAYDKQGSFAANISDSYYWVVPCYDKQSEVQVVRNNDTAHGWDIRRGTQFMKNVGRSYPDVVFVISSVYENILSRYPEVDKESMRMVYDEGNNIHLMYFTSDGAEYVVPYFSSKAITCVSNEKVYPVSDYINAMESNKAEDSAYDTSSAKKHGTEMIYFNYIVVGSIVVVGVAFVAFMIARRKMKKSAS